MIFLLFTCSKTPIPSEQFSTTIDLVDVQDINTLPDCGICHSQQAKEWTTSRHAQSWSNQIFQTSFTVATFPNWCQDCHQPILQENALGKQHDSGVGCLSCHLQEGHIVTSNPLSDTMNSPHSMRYDPTFGQSEFCAQCHQFNLPKNHPMYSDVPVQNTYQEWVNSGVEQHCQDCHMGNNGHSFPGAHNANFMSNAVDITVYREEETIGVSLSSINVGHALPTGDPFRRLQWRLCLDQDCSNVVARRTFVVMHQGPQWHVAQDNRLLPNETTKFSVPAPDAELWWSLVYFFGDPSLEGYLVDDDIWMPIKQGVIAN